MELDADGSPKKKEETKSKPKSKSGPSDTLYQYEVEEVIVDITVLPFNNSFSYL